MRDHVAAAAAASDGVAARFVGYVPRDLLSNGGDAGRRLWVAQTQRITTNNNTINIIVRVRQWEPETMTETVVGRERADGGQRLKGSVRFVSVSVVRSPHSATKTSAFGTFPSSPSHVYIQAISIHTNINRRNPYGQYV